MFSEEAIEGVFKGGNRVFSEGVLEGVFRGGKSVFRGGNRVCFQVVIACVLSIYFRGE